MDAETREKFWSGLGAKKGVDGFWRVGRVLVGCDRDEPEFADAAADDVPLEVLDEGLERLTEERGEELIICSSVYWDGDRIFTILTDSYELRDNEIPADRKVLAEDTDRRRVRITAICTLLGLEVQDG